VGKAAWSAAGTARFPDSSAKPLILCGRVHHVVHHFGRVLFWRATDSTGSLFPVGRYLCRASGLGRRFLSEQQSIKLREPSQMRRPGAKYR
jgi:hypothetical protein